MTNVAFRNFASGEITPSAYGRVDIEKYQSALRTMRNFVIQRMGGASSRAGTVFAQETKQSAFRSRLIPFISSDQPEDIYALEFGANYIRFYQDGAPVLVSGVPAWVDGTVYAAGNVVSDTGVNYVCIAAHTAVMADNEPGAGTTWQTIWYPLTGDILEIPTPYATADLNLIKYGQTQNELVLVHRNYPRQTLTRVSVSDPQQWTLTPMALGPSIAPPTNLSLSGGSAGVAYWWAVTSQDDTTGEESLAAIITAINKVPSSANPTTVEWDPVQGITTYNVYRSTDGITFAFVGDVNGQSLIMTSDTTWVDNDSTVTTAIEDTWVAAVLPYIEQDSVASIGQKAADGKYTINGNIFVSATGGANTTQGRAHAYYARDGEPLVDAGIIFTSAVLSGAGGGLISNQQFSATITVPDNGYSTLNIYVAAEVLGDGAGATFTCDVNEVGASPYDSITWNTAGTSFIDSAQVSDPTQAPPQLVQYFESPGNYPGCVARYQQRQIFGNTINDPGGFWASFIGSGGNFDQLTPVLDSGPVIFDADGDEAIAIKHLLDMGILIMFTSTMEKIVDGEAQTGILKPDAINVRTHSYNGCSDLKPLKVDKTVLYVQARGNQVRYMSTQEQSPSNADLTMVSDHLFRRLTLVDWAYSKVPDSIVWAVRSDGVLLGMTFLPEQQVWGWHRHDTDGLFESICVLPEGVEDRAYFIVNRTINGVQKRFVERMALTAVKDQTDVRDSHYMDAGALAFDGRNADDTIFVTLSGGVMWQTSEVLSLTASELGVFSSGDVGTTFLLIDPTSTYRLYFTVTSVSSSAVVKGYALTNVPVELQNVPTSDWARCADAVSGLDYLDGVAVSVLADGMVLSNPNNSEYPTMAVDMGALAFSRAYSVIRVGLPYVCDLETLDIDTAPATIKVKKLVINEATLFFENSAGVWIGQPNQPTADNILNGLEEIKLRDHEDYSDPIALVTASRNVRPQSDYNSNGRLLIRHVDPLPATLLMIAPTFSNT